MTTTESTTEAADTSWADPAWQVDSTLHRCCNAVGVSHARDCMGDPTTRARDCIAKFTTQLPGDVVPVVDSASMTTTTACTPAFELAALRAGCREIYGLDRNVTDHTIRAYPWAIQRADGTVDTAVVELADGENKGVTLNSDQARELAAHLLELAAQIDGWVK